MENLYLCKDLPVFTMKNIYITAAGKFLPNSPVSNEEIENKLGFIQDKPSRLKQKILQQNQIQHRYYALDKDQNSTHSNSQMAALAIQDCLKNANLEWSQIDFLAAATSQGDLALPSFASMVHGELGGQKPIEIASLHGICCSGVAALKNAFLHLQTDKKNAVVCASEFASRLLKSQRFENQTLGNNLPFDTEFLRWMLSDGAGALLLSQTPTKGISLKIEWIEMRSYAHLFDVCMYAGANKDRKGNLQKTWLDYPTFEAAAADGAINIKQDLKILHNIVTLGVDHFFDLLNQNLLTVQDIDYFLCHYSSHFFKGEILNLLEKGNALIEEKKWFTNLYEKGNTGSASIFIMLEELLNSQQLEHGQKILCMVPESGRFQTAFMYLTVEKNTENTSFVEKTIEAPTISHDQNKPVQARLVRDLTKVWIDFETQLNQVPIIQDIRQQRISLENYKKLLYNLRQQVVDGSQWISRAASNVSMDFFEIRSAFIRHAAEEHKDYQLLEANYEALGCDLDFIRNGKKNIGSEALSAFMFQKASQANPFELLGSMFIIEGLGNRVAGFWGRAIQKCLGLEKKHVSFFLYHENSDSNENHFERLEKALQSDLLTEEFAEKIVRTAQITAKLYLWQLQEVI